MSSQNSLSDFFFLWTARQQLKQENFKSQALYNTIQPESILIWYLHAEEDGRESLKLFVFCN